MPFVFAKSISTTGEILAVRKSLEKELKYHLSAKGYAKLLKALRPNIIQRDRLVNYYFDDSQLSLRKRRVGFRLRTTTGKEPMLTLKFPAKTKQKGPKGFKVRHEIEEPVSSRLAKAILSAENPIHQIQGKITQYLKALFPSRVIQDISLLGSLKTTRTKASLEKQFLLEIDRSEMFGKKFYELEVETETPVKADLAVRKLLLITGLPYQPIEDSKLSRFLGEWQKRQAPIRRKTKKRAARPQRSVTQRRRMR